MGVDMVITQKTIAKLLCSPNSGRFFMGTKDNSPEVYAITWCLFDDADNLCSSKFRKVKNMKKVFQVYIQNFNWSSDSQRRKF